MLHQQITTFRTRGRGTIDIIPEVEENVTESKLLRGVCVLFLQHTSEKNQVDHWQVTIKVGFAVK